MSPAPALSMLQLDDEEPVLGREACRFCGCTEKNRCLIPVREDERDGNFFLTRYPARAKLILHCDQYLPRVCNAPACIVRFVLESRESEPSVLLDQWGRTGS